MRLRRCGDSSRRPEANREGLSPIVFVQDVALDVLQIARADETDLLGAGIGAQDPRDVFQIVQGRQ